MPGWPSLQEKIKNFENAARIAEEELIFLQKQRASWMAQVENWRKENSILEEYHKDHPEELKFRKNKEVLDARIENQERKLREIKTRHKNHLSKLIKQEK